MHEGPASAPSTPEDITEQFLGLSAIEKMFLVRSSLVGIAGRDRHAHSKFLGEIEERRDVLRRMVVKDGGIDVDGEALGLGRPDCRDGAIEHPILAYRF